MARRCSAFLAMRMANIKKGVLARFSLRCFLDNPAKFLLKAFHARSPLSAQPR
jgi:hypothetical protein